MNGPADYVECGVEDQIEAVDRQRNSYSKYLHKQMETHQCHPAYVAAQLKPLKDAIATLRKVASGELK